MRLYTAWARTIGPLVEPISVTEAKQQARITGAEEDGLYLAYIKAAREAAEEALGYGLLTQTWQFACGDWVERLSLPMAYPLQNDSQANPSTAPVVQYYDTDGALQTLAANQYVVDTVSRPARIVRGPNVSWPTLQSDRQARVLVTYVVGWTVPALVPERIKQGIRLYVSAMDADRLGSVEAEPARQAALACWSDRVTWIEPVPYAYWDLPGPSPLYQPYESR